MKYLICAILLILSTTVCFPQIKSNCCGIRLNVSKYDERVDSFFREPVLLQMGILKPIEQSHAQFEIRQYQFYGVNSDVIVVSCNGKSKSAISYSTNLHLGKDVPSKGLFKSIGAWVVDPKFSVLLYKKRIAKLPSTAAYQSFLDSLSTNSFFNLPSEAELDRLIKRKNPDIALNGDVGVEVFEYKVGNHVGRVLYSKGYVPVPFNVQEYRFLLNINLNFINLIR